MGHPCRAAWTFVTGCGSIGRDSRHAQTSLRIRQDPTSASEWAFLLYFDFAPSAMATLYYVSGELRAHGFLAPVLRRAEGMIIPCQRLGDPLRSEGVWPVVKKSNQYSPRLSHLKKRPKPLAPMSVLPRLRDFRSSDIRLSALSGVVRFASQLIGTYRSDAAIVKGTA